MRIEKIIPNYAHHQSQPDSNRERYRQPGHRDRRYQQHVGQIEDRARRQRIRHVALARETQVVGKGQIGAQRSEGVSRHHSGQQHAD